MKLVGEKVIMEYALLIHPLESFMYDFLNASCFCIVYDMYFESTLCNIMPAFVPSS